MPIKLPQFLCLHMSILITIHVHGCCRFAALRTLDLSGIPRLQDGHLQGLSQLQLNCITLVGCEHITAMGLHHVGLAPGLTALDLTGCCKVLQAGSCFLSTTQSCSLCFASPDVMLHGLIWMSENRVIQSRGQLVRAKHDMVPSACSSIELHCLG